MERMWEDKRKLLPKKDNKKLLNDWLSKPFIDFSNKENYKDLVADKISSPLICNMSDLPSAGTACKKQSWS